MRRTLRNEASRPSECRTNAIYQFLEFQRDRLPIGDEHHIGTGCHAYPEPAHRFAEAAFRAVTLHSGSDPTGGRDADPRGSRFAAQQHVRNDGRR